MTGATGGIGKAITEMLLEEGFTVTMLGRDGDKFTAFLYEVDPRKTRNLNFIAGTVTDDGYLDEVVAFHTDHYGALDLLVNNAGVAGHRRIGELDAALVDEQLAVNLRAVIMLTNKCLPLLRSAVVKRGSAQIVNTASNAGKRGEATLASYSATKAGVVGFTEALHDELASEGIKATAICPGLVDTPMADEYRSGGAVEMISPRDVAETVRLTTRLSRGCIVPEIILLRPTEWIAPSEVR